MAATPTAPSRAPWRPQPPKIRDFLPVVLDANEISQAVQAPAGVYSFFWMELDYVGKDCDAFPDEPLRCYRGRCDVLAFGSTPDDRPAHAGAALILAPHEMTLLTPVWVKPFNHVLGARVVVTDREKRSESVHWGWSGIGPTADGHPRFDPPAAWPGCVVTEEDDALPSCLIP